MNDYWRLARCVSSVGFFAIVFIANLSRATAQPDSKGPQVAYKLPTAGKVVVVINDGKGRRVRNLVAEADRTAGEHRESWDGRDDQGKLMPPGEYTFAGAVTPPLKLIYEFTLNNSGTVPWWRNVDNGNPMKEKGGWMSDHSPPTDVATLGDHVFLAADATEHGNSLNVVDLDGKQVWATRWFGLAGARFVATDDRFAYVAGEGAWIGNKFQLFVLSPQSFEFRKLVEFGFDNPASGGGLAGLAAHGGKIAVSFNGKLSDAMTSAIAADLLDHSATTRGNLQSAQVAGILRAVEPKQPWVNLPLPEDGVLHLAWKEPRAVGAVLSPHRLETAVLKPDAKYPGDPKQDSDWEVLESGPVNGVMNVYTAPGGRRARAMRVRVLNSVSPRAWAEPEAERRLSETAPKWFTGLRIIRPALRGLGGETLYTASTGTVFRGGAWENVQKTDITPENPAVYTVNFAQPKISRGFIVRDPFFVSAEVEVKTKPDGPWIHRGKLTARLPWRRAYTESLFDFHRDTTVAALRLKVTQPATNQNADAKKRTGGRGNVCSLGGIVLLGTDAFDPPVPADRGQRVAFYSAADGSLMQDISISEPGPLEFTNDGRLLAISGSQVVHVPLDGKPSAPVIFSGLIRPTGLTVDDKGRIYVSDSGDHVVKRFTPSGKLDLIIGKPGGLDVGPYDPAHMSNPRGLAIDSRGRLWVAEHEHHPKRVSVWSLANPQAQLVAYYIGGPPYGGGIMHPDPRVPSRFFFQGMEFQADWRTGKSQIKNILWRGGKGQSWSGPIPKRPVYIRDQLFLVSEPHYFYDGFRVPGYQVVTQYDKARGQAIPVAAAGKADSWPPLKNPALRGALGIETAGKKAFIWSDQNFNEGVEADEIQLKEADGSWNAWAWHVHSGYGLALQFPKMCLVPVKLRTKGKKAVPMYSFERTHPTPPIAGAGTIAYGTQYHGMAVTRDNQIIELSNIVSVRPRSGNPLWTYPAPWPGTQMSGKAASPRPGLVVGQLGVIGGAVLPKVGELFAFVADKGEIYVFTTDGLFVARLFRDNRYGRSFNFPHAQRGMEVGGVSINGEHFGGTFTQLADGRIILVVGHNHNSVVRIEGLEKIQRFAGNVQLTAAQYSRAERAIVAKVSQAESKTLFVPRAPKDLVVDGRLNEWKRTAFVELKGAGEHTGLVSLTWDQERLMLAYIVRGRPQLQNSGKDWSLLFKSGDSVDLQLGTNPNADPKRATPAPGDWRFSLSRFQDQPITVLYRYRVPGSPASERKTFASPVGSVVIDSVERINGDIKIARLKGGYVVEAAIPWKNLHTAPPVAGTSWRGDLGILFASQGGGGVAERLYWSNRDTGLISDVPGEIRLRPALWGEIRFE